MAAQRLGNGQTVNNSMLPVYIISLATFIIFFQGFMVAPLLPMFSGYFHTSVRHVSFIEPAYLMGYGIFTLVYAPMSDRHGRFKVITVSMFLFTVLTMGTALATDIDQMIALRLMTGMGAAGVAPTTISWISDTHPYQQRGHALGIFFGCMAGGAAFGSSVGAVLSSLIGWRCLFLCVSAIGLAMLIAMILLKTFLFDSNSMPNLEKRSVLTSFRQILAVARARRTYLFVLLNGMFHSGIFAWLGYFLHLNYGLRSMQIGLALLGYGIPGLLLGPLLGKLSDRHGRNKIIPLGILISSISVLVLSWVPGLTAACMLITILSLGFDLSHPLFAAIVTTFSASKGAATGLFAFFLFIGYGLGSLILSLIISIGLNNAFQCYGICAFLASMIAIRAFREER